MIAVIIPFYKNEATIHRCINSLLTQSNRDYRIIAVDDGSPDRCGEICDEYAEKCDNISVIHQQNQGLSAARNAGIEMALADETVDWISFIDGDDWVHKDYLRCLVGACLENQTNISVCRFVKATGFCDDGDNSDFCVTMKDSDSFGGVSEPTLSSIVAWGKLFNKSIIGEIRFPVGRLNEDLFTTYKWLAKEDKIAIVEIPLYYYYSNPNGIMGSKWTPQKIDALDALAEQLVSFKNNNMSLSLANTQYMAIRWIEYSVIASDGSRDADARIKSVIGVINTEVYDDLSDEVKKRLKRLKSFGWFRFRNKVLVFRNYLKEKGFKYAFDKLFGHFRKGCINCKRN